MEAVKAYQGVAQEAGMSLTAMAIRFVLSHPLVSCAVAGATDEGQLRELAEAARLGPLEEGVLEAIDAVHARLPNPTP